MHRLLTFIICTLLCLTTFSSFGQMVFKQIQNVPVVGLENEFILPWAGGLNSAQYNKADLDGDDIEELILYDRSANVYVIFKIEEGKLIPANELFFLLPDIPQGWVLFVDYNLDGKKDIFSNGERGVVVFKNISETNELTQWVKVADPLLTTGFSGKINLIANSTDVPAISDIDSDGDMDILVYNFAIGGYIRYNKNLSQELFGNSDSLEYEIATRSWGEFEECDCNDFMFSGETCSDLSNGRVTHPGGKALLAIDTDGDGDKDLLAGHEQCIELYFFENMGVRDSAYMVNYSNMFPDDEHPANFQIFPAGYFEDLDFDGVKDLVVTPSFEENYGFKIDFAHSNWFYKNNGTTTSPDFEYQSNNLIQKQMIDFGEISVPAFTDLTADGKADLLVGANGYWNGDNFSGNVIEFQNTGTMEEPSFKVMDENYLDLASLNLINPTINMVDFDGDSAVDLVYSGMQLQDFKLASWLLINQSSANAPASYDLGNKQEIQLPETSSYNDNPVFFDVDEDGYTDLLLGKGDGALHYYKNKGDNSFELIDPAFMGIDRDFSQERRNLVATVGDLDKNNEADLMVTDSRGVGRIYFSFRNQMNMESEFIEIAFINEVAKEEEPIKFDQKSWIASYDLYNQGTESILAGGIRGGLQLFQNTSTGSNGGTGSSLKVNIYPNPVFDDSGLTIKSNQDISVELISLLGQRMLGPFSLKKYTTAILDLGNYQNGTYILKSTGATGTISSQLFMIQR